MWPVKEKDTHCWIHWGPGQRGGNLTDIVSNRNCGGCSWIRRSVGRMKTRMLMLVALDMQNSVVKNLLEVGIVLFSMDVVSVTCCCVV